MSILSKVNSNLEEEGLGYVIQRAPHYIRRRVQSKISDGVYRIYNPYGELSRGDMISHCENNDQIWYYSSHDEFEINPPVTGPIPKPFDDLIGVHQSVKPFVCELNDVRLVGDRAIPQMKDGKYVLEEMGTESTLKSRVLNTFNKLNNSQKVREIFLTFLNRRQRYDYSILINLVPRHGQGFNDYANFAHWLLEDLPRLRAYEHYVSATDRQPKILIKTNPPRWMVDTLKCLGFDQDDWVEWNQSAGLVETLVVPKLNYIHSSGSRFSPSGREWVGNQIKSNCSSDASEFSKNIIISRQKSKRRRISNFDEVMKALRPLGFESYQLENLSIGEEISLFSQANIIVGVHGAGLATSIYAESAAIIEIFPYDLIATTYYILANEMNLEYAYLKGEKNIGKHTDSKKNQDIKVNIDKLVSKASDVMESYP